MIYSIQDDFFTNPKKERGYFFSETPQTCTDSSEWHGNDLRVLAEHDLRTIDKFSRLLPGYSLINNFKTYNWAISNPANAVHIHWDADDVIGVVYLNETYTDEDATLLLRHRKTGTTHKDQHDFGDTETGNDLHSRLGNDEFNLDRWETICRVPCKFNRMLLFCPQYYHAASRTFGTDLASSRLVQVFHFKRTG